MKYKIILTEEEYQTLLIELRSLYRYHWNDDHIHQKDCGSQVLEVIEEKAEVIEG